MDLISDFCKKNGLFLITDLVSSFLADPFDMKKYGVGLMITSSQKALACPPGISICVLSKEALKRVENTKSKSYYFDFKSALKNQERGQTPFTPAVSILIQINRRLKEIEEIGGVEAENDRIKGLALYFREKIKDLPFEYVTNSMSYAVTSLRPKNVNAYSIFEVLKNEYEIWICPNGGDLKEKIFRVGHIGYLKKEDYDKLLDAFNDLLKRELI